MNHYLETAQLRTRDCDLNGVWRFAFARNEEQIPPGFEQPACSCAGWDSIPVPAHIQMEGYGVPQYLNTQYPWDGLEEIEPGQIPERFNPVGFYITDFEVPESWEGEGVRVSFQGVESGFALWLNGSYVGYSEDSFTPAEFDLSPYVCEGSNRLAVMVFKWSAGSWCEDQDFFRFSGIFRSVFLYMLPETAVTFSFRPFFSFTLLEERDAFLYTLAEDEFTLAVTDFARAGVMVEVISNATVSTQIIFCKRRSISGSPFR